MTVQTCVEQEDPVVTRSARVERISTRRSRLIVASLSIASLLPMLSINARAQTPSASCGRYRDDRRLRIGSHTIAAQVAVTDAELQRGLGGRPCIPANQGMLFVFAQQGLYPFWMKDMSFPIDIVWINAQHDVVAVRRDLSPSTYPQTYVSGEPAQYVLELQANRARSLGIVKGTTIAF
jgi:uncharacterized membrane protein (UPF0127 family)